MVILKATLRKWNKSF